jgi:LAO/AO transport system kinase
MEIVERILGGDVRATARVLRDIDDEIPSARDVLRELYGHAGRAYVIGFTGSPGVGKSTLVDQLALLYRRQGKTVGILAVDPTSLDSGVFIRSLATRGHFGGITKSTNDMVTVLDAMGKDVILIETVGVGQDEVEIAHSAHSTVLATIPGMGDEIQALKAGILEIGNIFVVNKAEREGSRKTVRELRSLLELGARHRSPDGWAPPIIETEAVKARGMEELFSAIEKHREFLLGGKRSEWREVVEKRARLQLLEALRDEVFRTILDRLEDRGASLDEMVKMIVDRRSDPYTMVQEIISREMKNPGNGE